MQACIDRGAARVVVKNNIEYILFPKLEFGQRASSSNSRSTQRAAVTDSATFKSVEAVVASLSWGIVATQATLEAHIYNISHVSSSM